MLLQYLLKFLKNDADALNMQYLHSTIVILQNSISFLGTLVIFIGVLFALYLYIQHFNPKKKEKIDINRIRLNLGRSLILGLEFIVAADLIRTTTAPDYYSVGILASIVLIRTVLSFSINRELQSLTKEK